MQNRLQSLAALCGAFVLAACASTRNEAGKDVVRPYPLDTCIVSDEKLGEMGEPFAFVHKGQEIKLCCKPCQKDFNKNPEKYLKKIEKADKKK